MGIGEEALDPAIAPSDRPAERARRKEDGGVFRIALRLHSEPAAHVMGEHADRRERHLEDALGQELAHHRDALGAGNQRVALPLGVPHSDAGARLHRSRREPRVEEPHALDMGGTREGRLDRTGIAIGPVERDIAGRRAVDRRRTGGGGALDVGGARELGIVDRDPLGGILRLLPRLRHHDRHRLADVADAIDREHRHGSGNHRLAVTPDRAGDRRNGAEPGGGEIRAGIDAEDAGHRARPPQRPPPEASHGRPARARTPHGRLPRHRDRR